ncbi:MAG: reverse transcriptase N-terminal domain-containing protein [Trichodesmium sp. St11_bin5]|nr:reverse transcriptase N-terminal domain-containing protein [Trichodesmium sp. St11_bin5]
MTSSYYPRLLAVWCVIQDKQDQKTAGVDGMKNLLSLQGNFTVRFTYLKLHIHINIVAV